MEFENKNLNYQEHALNLYNTKPNGEIISISKWYFEIYPELKCTKVLDHFPDGRVVPFQALEKELIKMSETIKLFLFKQRASPVYYLVNRNSNHESVWQIEPEFNEDEKRYIMRLSLFNTL